MRKKKKSDKIGYVPTTFGALDFCVLSTPIIASTVVLWSWFVVVTFVVVVETVIGGVFVLTISTDEVTFWLESTNLPLVDGTVGTNFVVVLAVVVDFSVTVVMTLVVLTVVTGCLVVVVVLGGIEFPTVVSLMVSFLFSISSNGTSVVRTQSKVGMVRGGGGLGVVGLKLLLMMFGMLETTLVITLGT